MPGKSIKIGPFKKGLNNISQAGECEDDEVVKLINFEVALDTSLTCRPPIEVVNGSLISSNYTSLYKVFGIYRVSATEWYVIAQYQTGASQWTLAAILNGDPTSTVLVINTFTSLADIATCYAQWNDTCYFNTATGAANVGFSWKKGAAGVTLLNTTNLVMPHGNILISWKARLWTIDTQTSANANMMAYSYIDQNGSHPDQWRSNGTYTGTDTFPVDQGAGGFITCILPLANSLLVFKSDATYRFAYAASPAQGQVDRLSDYIGCSNQYCAINFENYVYILHQGRVYELINNLFIQINKLVYFQSDGDNSCVDLTAPTVAMSAVSRRIIVQYNNTMYVYGIDTKTWSQWRSFSGTPGKFFLMPQDPASAAPLSYIAASQGTTQNPSTNYILDTTSNVAIAYMNGAIGSGYTVTNVSDASMPSGSADVVTTGASVPAGAASLYMNGQNTSTNFNIPCGSGTVFTVAGTVNQSGTFTINATLNCLLRNGSTATVTAALPAFVSGTTYTAFSVNLTAPANTIEAYLTFNTVTGAGSMPANSTFKIGTDVSIKRAQVQSPITMLKLTDHHYSSGSSVEYIEAILNTKSYDYQAPANVKRLFWWGLDCVTKRDINTVTVPIAQVTPPTWAQLQAYTWAQLAQSTWGNPLAWRGQSLNVIDYDSLASSMTANGRVFAKNLKALRFRQIQFNITMTSLGNTSTGPCKIFSLTTWALPHEKESAKVS